MEWIKCSECLPPKDQKFLFHYHYGIGLGQWGETEDWVNGCEERGPEKYYLVLHPSEIIGIYYPFIWDEKYMIHMEVSWMNLPEEPKE